MAWNQQKKLSRRSIPSVGKLQGKENRLKHNLDRSQVLSDEEGHAEERSAGQYPIFAGPGRNNIFYFSALKAAGELIKKAFRSKK